MRKPWEKGPLEEWDRTNWFYDHSVWVTEEHTWPEFDGAWDVPFGRDEVRVHRIAFYSNDRDREDDHRYHLLCGKGIEKVRRDVADVIMPAVRSQAKRVLPRNRALPVEGVKDPLVDDVGVGFSKVRYMLIERAPDVACTCTFSSRLDERWLFDAVIGYGVDGEVLRADLSVNRGEVRHVRLDNVLGELVAR